MRVTFDLYRGDDLHPNCPLTWDVPGSVPREDVIRTFLDDYLVRYGVRRALLDTYPHFTMAIISVD